MNESPIEKVTLNPTPRPSSSSKRDTCIKADVSATLLRHSQKMRDECSDLVARCSMLDKHGFLCPTSRCNPPCEEAIQLTPWSRIKVREKSVKQNHY